MNEKFCILIRIPLKFVPEGPVDNKAVLVQVMACRLFGTKPLPETKPLPMLTQSVDETASHDQVAHKIGCLYKLF